MSEKRKVTDKEAVEALNIARKSKLNIADTFVPRTIVYGVSLEYRPGVFTREIRTFVRQGEYCSARQWERALELEKEFKELNKIYSDAVKAKGKPVNIKGSSNPLNATPIDAR